MRGAVLALGIVGVFLGVLFGACGVVVGETTEALGDENTINAQGWIAILAAFCALFLAMLAFRSRGSAWGKVWAGLLVVAAAVHTIAIGLFGVPGGIFLFIAGVFGFFIKRPRLDDAYARQVLAEVLEGHREANRNKTPDPPEQP